MVRVLSITVVVLVLVGELAGLALGYRTLLDRDDRTAISKCKNSIGRRLFNVTNFSRQEEISALPIRKKYPTVAHLTPPDFHRTAQKIYPAPNICLLLTYL